MKNTATPRLSWKQLDFVNADCDLPKSLIHDSIHTEGELLTQDEIKCWLKDTQATFSIIRQQDEARFEKLFEDFLTDIKYLQTIRKLTADEAEEVSNKNLYSF